MGRNARGDLGLPTAVRRGLTGRADAILLLGALLLPALLAHADTYRWVDEHGSVHYGDSIPPRYQQKAHDQLDSQGRLMRHYESAEVSAQERQRRAEEAARQEEARRAAIEQQRYDNALLSTYSSVAEIDKARDRQLSQEMAVIDSLTVQLKQAENKKDVEQIDAAIFRHYQNIRDIRTRFASDRARYLELTGKR